MLKAEIISATNLEKSKDIFLRTMLEMHQKFPIQREPAKPHIPKPSSNPSDINYHKEWLEYHTEMIELIKNYENTLIEFNQEKEKTKRFKLASKKDVILGIIRLLLSNIYDRDSLSKETISLMQTNLPQHFVDNHYSNEETFDKIYEGIQFLYVLNGHKFTSGSW